MRYSKSHKDETRRRLLDSSRALVKHGGFNTTGVDALMSAIGLTSGAFYSHFPSKQALLEAVIQEEIDSSVQRLSPPPDAEPAQVGKMVKLYLSGSHAQNPDQGCVIPALGPEIGRSTPEVRAIVEAGLKKLRTNWSRLLDDDAAQAVLAQCVGALILARSVKTEKARNEILEANRRHIERLLAAFAKD